MLLTQDGTIAIPIKKPWYNYNMYHVTCQAMYLLHTQSCTYVYSVEVSAKFRPGNETVKGVLCISGLITLYNIQAFFFFLQGYVVHRLSMTLCIPVNVCHPHLVNAIGLQFLCTAVG